MKDNEHTINADSFSLSKLNVLYNDRGFDSKSGERKDFTEAKKYVLKYFFRTNGGYFLNQNGIIEMKSTPIISDTYIKRFPNGNKKEFINWFNNSPDITIYRPVCIPNRQLIVGDTINTMSKTLHTADMKYDECREQDKKAVKMMLNFINEVWASEDKSQYEYILNWLAKTIQGGKNQTLLYIKSTTEGIGKSTLTDFLKEYVLGYKVCEQSTSYPLLTGNNTTLYGKMLVVFEELGKTTKIEWEKMSSCLKEWITSDMISFNQKYVAPFTSNNINNYIINTNTECLRGADGRRYFVADLSTKYKNDFKFWDLLHKTCFNESVGKAFYLYMIERDITGFNSAKFPMTKRKEQYMADLIKSPYKFIKYNYVLTNRNFTLSVAEFYEQYLLYCEKTDQKSIQKRPCVALLREVNIHYKTSNSKSLYNVDNKTLQDIAIKYQWLSPDDAEEMSDNLIWKDYTIVKDIAVSNNINHILAKDYEDEIEKLKQQILLLQQENAELKRTEKKPELTEQHSEFSSNVPATPKKEKKEKKPKKEKQKKDKSKSKKEKPKKDKSKSKVNHLQLFLDMPDIDNMFNN